MVFSEGVTHNPQRAKRGVDYSLLHNETLFNYFKPQASCHLIAPGKFTLVPIGLATIVRFRSIQFGQKMVMGIQVDAH